MRRPLFLTLALLASCAAIVTNSRVFAQAVSGPKTFAVSTQGNGGYVYCPGYSTADVFVPAGSSLVGVVTAQTASNTGTFTAPSPGPTGNPSWSYAYAIGATPANGTYAASLSTFPGHITVTLGSQPYVFANLTTATSGSGSIVVQCSTSVARAAGGGGGGGGGSPGPSGPPGPAGPGAFAGGALNLVQSSPSPIPTATYAASDTIADNVLGADGNQWFSFCTTDKIGKMTTTGTETDYPIQSGSHASIYAMALGSDNRVWYADNNNGLFGAITTSGVNSTFASSEATSTSDMVLGSDGNIWAAGTTDLDKIQPNGTITQYSLGSGNAPSSVAAGADGNIYAAGQNSTSFHGYIWKVSTNGTILATYETNPGTGGNFPHLSHFSPDGRLWATYSSGGDPADYYPCTVGTCYATLAITLNFKTASYYKAGLNNNQWDLILPNGVLWSLNGGITEMQSNGNAEQFFQPSGGFESEDLGSDNRVWVGDNTTAEFVVFTPPEFFYSTQTIYAAAPHPMPTTCTALVECDSVLIVFPFTYPRPPTCFPTAYDETQEVPWLATMESATITTSQQAVALTPLGTISSQHTLQVSVSCGL